MKATQLSWNQTCCDQMPSPLSLFCATQTLLQLAPSCGCFQQCTRRLYAALVNLAVVGNGKGTERFLLYAVTLSNNLQIRGVFLPVDFFVEPTWMYLIVKQITLPATLCVFALCNHLNSVFLLVKWIVDVSTLIHTCFGICASYPQNTCICICIPSCRPKYLYLYL